MTTKTIATKMNFMVVPPNGVPPTAISQPIRSETTNCSKFA
ncbi:hypothetical protein [Helicobacter pylori]|nr:hypothetical protein [Helicobacter pylori]